MSLVGIATVQRLFKVALTYFSIIIIDNSVVSFGLHAS